MHCHRNSVTVIQPGATNRQSPPFSAVTDDYERTADLVAPLSSTMTASRAPCGTKYPEANVTKTVRAPSIPTGNGSPWGRRYSFISQTTITATADPTVAPTV